MHKVIVRKVAIKKKAWSGPMVLEKVINIVCNIIGGVQKTSNPLKSNGNQAIKAPPKYGCGRSSCLTNLLRLVTLLGTE